MIRSRVLITLSLYLTAANLYSQERDTLRKGIHQEESEFYSPIYPKDMLSDGKGTEFPSDLNKTYAKSLTAKVLGWHPYWASSTAYLNYNYDALSHIAYFSYEVDTSTGGYITIRGWNTTSIIDYAHQRGTKVLLTVTNFGSKNNTSLLSHTDRQIFLLNTLIPLLKSRNADGVNFDLENVSVSQRNNLINFMQIASDMIKAEMPEAEISMATPAVDWSGSWDLKKLSEICDYLIVMGYNYYWSSSSTAGPVAPLAGENYNVSKSVNTYLTAGVLPEKLMLGVPWYGYDWPVSSAVRKATATGSATSRTYAASQTLAAQHTTTFDETTSTPWLNYMSGSLYRQLWYDDSESLLVKYDFAASKGLSGIGIWAISYEGTYNEVWSTIREVFAEEEPAEADIIGIFPNPVKGSSEISFSLIQREKVSIKIFDSSGRERMIIEDEELDPGFYTKVFRPDGFSTGIYICTLRTKMKITSRKIVIIK